MNDLKKETEFVNNGLREIKGIVSSKRLGVDYVTICALALELLERVLGKEYSFPIDIQAIVRKLGIDIICQPLNLMWQEEKYVHKLVGTSFIRPSILNNKSISCIWIDSDSNQEEQRYALAHELAHCLINDNGKTYSSDYYLMPMLFKDMEEMVADIFAIFLLIPIPAFFEIFYEYIKVQNKPVSTSEWLEYLSTVANVSYAEVSIGYQNIRYVSGIIHKLRHGALTLEELLSGPVSPDVKNIVMKQFRKIVENMSDEMEELLYL